MAGHHIKAPKGPSAPSGERAVLRAVAGLTARVEAVERYELLGRRLEADRRAVAAAQAAAVAARIGVASSAASVRTADDDAGRIRSRLAQLAVAAYTGSAVASPAGAGPAGAFGTHGQEADVADVMVTVIFDDAERASAATPDIVARAQAVERTADATVDAARRVILADQRLVTGTEQQMTEAAAAARATDVPSGVSTRGPDVLGPALVTASELAGWYRSTGENPHTTVNMARLAADYVAAGRTTGVRADIAFAQSVVETGYFSFPSGGQLVGGDNNFAGIGACDSCSHGWSFRSARVGVGTQLELLEAYARTRKVPTPLLRGTVGIGGCCRTWMSLSGHWATNPSYGVEILSVYDSILAWVLPRQLAASGLR